MSREFVSTGRPMKTHKGLQLPSNQTTPPPTSLLWERSVKTRDVTSLTLLWMACADVARLSDLSTVWSATALPRRSPVRRDCHLMGNWRSEQVDGLEITRARTHIKNVFFSKRFLIRAEWVTTPATEDRLTDWLLMRSREHQRFLSNWGAFRKLMLNQIKFFVEQLLSLFYFKQWV